MPHGLMHIALVYCQVCDNLLHAAKFCSLTKSTLLASLTASLRLPLPV